VIVVRRGWTLILATGAPFSQAYLKDERHARERGGRTGQKMSLPWLMKSMGNSPHPREVEAKVSSSMKFDDEKIDTEGEFGG
jgi:hypothetical protein